jgi:hypothetical protein
MSLVLTRIKRWWLVAFLVLSACYVVYYLWSQMAHPREEIRLAPAWLVSAGVFHVAFLFVASSNWSRIVQSSTGLSLTLLESFRQLAIVSLGKYLPGKVWGAIARGALLVRRGVQTSGSVLATFHEQYLLVVSGIAIFALCSAFVVGARWTWLALVGGGVVVVSGFYAQALGLRVVRRVVSGSDNSAGSNGEGFAWNSYMRLIARFLLLWLLNGLIFASLDRALFSSPPDLDRIAILILANAAGITAGFFALFAPGGIGVREAVSSTILATIMPLTDALMLGVVFRIWVTAVELLSSLTVVSELRWQQELTGS